MPSRRNACNFLLFLAEGMKEIEGFIKEKIYDKWFNMNELCKNEAFEALFGQM